MQTRSRSLLLMIVSIAIADLPVWRSPMMSSRWPRPMGIIESIALRPVSIGTSTGWRLTTPGAGDGERPAGALDRVALLHLVPGAEEHGPDVVGLEVGRQAGDVVRELEKFE